jgi:hypothetical protein
MDRCEIRRWIVSRNPTPVRLILWGRKDLLEQPSEGMQQAVTIRLEFV